MSASLSHNVSNVIKYGCSKLPTVKSDSFFSHMFHAQEGLSLLDRKLADVESEPAVSDVHIPNGDGKSTRPAHAFLQLLHYGKSDVVP